MRLYMPIQKAEELDDGTLRVTGIASTEAVDSAGEVVKADAIEGALPEFFRFGTGPLREMHQLSAAGTVDKAEVVDGITSIEATVVDPVAIRKVKAGVYKGFSIGGAVGARDSKDKKLITKIRLNEISLVDRPCNPEAVITMYKAEASAEETNVSDDPKALRKARVTELAALLDKGGDDLLVKLLEVAKAPAEPPADETVEKTQETPVAEAAQAPAGDPPATDAQQPPTAEAATKAEKPSGDVLRKGMYTLAELSSICMNLANVAAGADAEAMWEGDNSPIPARLRECLAECCSILVAMTAEETAEMLASLAPKTAADAAGDLAKAGTTEPPAAAAPAADAAGAAPVQAAAPPLVMENPDDFRKAITAPLEDALAKRDEQLAKALAAVDTLTKRVEALEQQPAPGKALLKAIGKGDDVSTPDPKRDDIEPIRKADGSIDEAATELKKIHARGGIPVRFS